MNFQIITLFPELITEALRWGVAGAALRKKQIELKVINPREFTSDVHHTVDDTPFGGGDGMVMMAEPLEKALQSLPHPGRVVFLSPQGELWSDKLARQWAAEAQETPEAEPQSQSLTLICGRYAGVDQRFLVKHKIKEISIGDYILSGGELAALILIDSLARLMPGVLGNQESADKDSFADDLLEGPQFTKPREYGGMAVPETLLSGHHKKIQEWRFYISVLKTSRWRPDLLEKRPDAKKILSEAKKWLESISDEELIVCGFTQQDIEALR